MKTGRFSAAERIGLMKIFQISVALALSTCMLPGLAAGSHLQQDASSGAQAPAEQTPPAQTSAPAPAATGSPQLSEYQGPAPLRVMVGKSLLINTTERLKRVSVTDSAVAD